SAGIKDRAAAASGICQVATVSNSRLSVTTTRWAGTGTVWTPWLSVTSTVVASGEVADGDDPDGPAPGSAFCEQAARPMAVVAMADSARTRRRFTSMLSFLPQGFGGDIVART